MSAVNKAQVFESFDIAARLDRLPISRFHYRLFFILAVGMFFDGIDLYVLSGVMAVLIKTGWATMQNIAYLVSVSFIGLGAGGLLSGILSDRFGRRTMFVWNMLIYSVASLFCAISLNYEMLLAARFFCTLGLGGEIVTGYTLMGEFIPPSKRGQWGNMLFLSCNVALPVITFLSKFVIPLSPEAWRWLFVFSGVPALLAWYIRRGMPESPRWYHSMGRTGEAQLIVSSIEAEIERETGKKLPPISEATLAAYNVNEEHHKFLHLFDKFLITRTILTCIIFMGTGAIVYSMTLWLPTMFCKSGFDIVKSMEFSTLMVLGGPVGAILAILVADKIKRKWNIVALCIIGAILGYLYAMSRGNYQILLLGFGMVTVIYMITGITYTTYIPELFPTRLRASGAGLGTTLGRLSSAVSPFFVVTLMSCFGFGGVSLAISLLFIIIGISVGILGIETKGKTLEELQQS